MKMKITFNYLRRSPIPLLPLLPLAPLAVLAVGAASLAPACSVVRPVEADAGRPVARRFEAPPDDVWAAVLAAAADLPRRRVDAEARVLETDWVEYEGRRFGHLSGGVFEKNWIMRSRLRVEVRAAGDASEVIVRNRLEERSEGASTGLSWRRAASDGSAETRFLDAVAAHLGLPTSEGEGS